MRRPLIAVCAAALIFTAACSVDESADGPLRALGAEDRALVDRIVAAQQAGDWGAIESVVGFTQQPCVMPTPDVLIPAPCHDGEPEGTIVDAFFYGFCHSAFWRPEDRETLIDRRGETITTRADLYAVVATTQQDHLNTDYHIVFEYRERRGEGFWFSVRDHRVVAQSHSCGGIENSFSIGDKGRLPIIEY